MGISRDKWHKRRKTGGRQGRCRKKRKFELGRPAAATKLLQEKLGVEHKHRIHRVRTRGGNTKYRALRLFMGNFSWGSEAQTRKTRILDCNYNASSNELVRTKTLVKNSVITIDAAPFRQWYEGHYALPLGRKKGRLTDEESQRIYKKRSSKLQKKYDERKKTAAVEHALEEQFTAGRLLACISSRPGQTGRCDGYILEGRELEFYQRKLKAKKGK